MATPAEQTNTFDPEVVKPLVAKIEGYYSEIESEKGAFMQRCRTIHESITAVFDEGAARGVPKKPLKRYIKARRKLAAARHELDDLEPDQRETVDLIAHSVNDPADLPLFAYAAERQAAA